MSMRFVVARRLLAGLVGCGPAGGVGAGQPVATTLEFGSEEQA